MVVVPSVFHIYDDIVMVHSFATAMVAVNLVVAAVDLVLPVVMVGMMVVVEEVVVVAMTDGSIVPVVVVVEFVNGSLLPNSMLVIRSHFEYYSY